MSVQTMNAEYTGIDHADRELDLIVRENLELKYQQSRLSVFIQDRQTLLEKRVFTELLGENRYLLKKVLFLQEIMPLEMSNLYIDTDFELDNK